MSTNTHLQKDQWVILSPEFPPSKSGVAYFSRQLAENLALIGEKVQVHSIRESTAQPTEFELTTGKSLASVLSNTGQKQRVFIQYTPKTMSANIVKELQQLSQDNSLLEFWTFFHDLEYIKPKQNFIAAWALKNSQKKNIKRLSKISKRIYIPTPKWEEAFKNFKQKLIVQPIPSNVPYIPDEIRATNQRKAFAGSAQNVLCSFGSFNDRSYNEYLRKLIPSVLSKTPSCKWILVGRKSEQFRDSILKDHDSLTEKIQSAGELDASAISAHIQASDLLIQPYPDGVSTKRSSAMAALAHGKPLITSFGPSTETFWSSEKIAAPLDITSIATGTSQVNALIASPQNRNSLSKRSKQKYEDNFSINHLIQAITLF